MRAASCSGSIDGQIANRTRKAVKDVCNSWV